MISKYREICFNSPLAHLMQQFVLEKQACGYKYQAGTRLLVRLDEYLTSQGLETMELPWPMIQQWTAKQPNEAGRNHQARISGVRQFAKFMCRMGYPTPILGKLFTVKDTGNFSPRILTHEEMRRLFFALDQLRPTAMSPMRHHIMPEIFRLLYGCGFRIREVLHLKVQDADLKRGVLTIRRAKFGKDRLVPPAPSLVQRLRHYDEDIGHRHPNAYFFPSPSDGPWSLQAVYYLFRQLLLHCGIAHAGRGKGPRLHDLRHTFAVHTLLRWYQEGADLDAKLPVLATYLGHQSLNGTQRYLHLTAELFPEITRRTNADFGDVIPRRVIP